MHCTRNLQVYYKSWILKLEDVCNDDMCSFLKTYNNDTSFLLLFFFFFFFFKINLVMTFKKLYFRFILVIYVNFLFCNFVSFYFFILFIVFIPFPNSICRGIGLRSSLYIYILGLWPKLRTKGCPRRRNLCQKKLC